MYMYIYIYIYTYIHIYIYIYISVREEAQLAQEVVGLEDITSLNRKGKKHKIIIIIIKEKN